MAVNNLNIGVKERQHLIVIFTKADLLMGMEGIKLSDSLKEYLLNGDCNVYRQIDAHLLSKIENKSREIRDWLMVKQALGFITEAEDNFKSVEYTIVSSIGANPERDRLGFELTPEEPKRVLDPFLLALSKIHKKGVKEKIFK